MKWIVSAKKINNSGRHICLVHRGKPTLKSKNGHIIRFGRGYSLQELEQVGLDIHVAKKNGVPIDVWRRTRYQENIDNLKQFAENIINVRWISKEQKSKPNAEAYLNKHKSVNRPNQTRKDKREIDPSTIEK